MIILAIGGLASADELEIKLRGVDALREGTKTRFDEVDRRCQQLLVEYTTPEEQARIYHAWAHVEGQSGIRHPAKQLDLVKKALALPLDPEKRLQLYMYWGNSLEVSNRGVTGGSLNKARAEIVVPYLKGMAEALDHVVKTNNTVVPAPPAKGEEGPADNKALTARTYAQAQMASTLERLEASRTAFENQIALLYSRRPFATDEIEKLAPHFISDKAARDRLLAAVSSAVDQRKRELAAAPTKNSTSWFISVNAIVLSVLAVVYFIWRRFRAAA